MSIKLKQLPIVLLALLLVNCTANKSEQQQQAAATKDLSYFLNQMLTLDHLPELENSHTAMASTWDRKGGNWDGNYFEKIEGNINVLCEEDGPGCIYRIFSGRLENLYYEKKDPKLDMTKVRLQIYLDKSPTPVIDCPVRDFFVNNPIVQYPFVFDNLDNFKRTYPGFLLPIPFSSHLKVQLLSPEPNPYYDNWGNFWQITYKTFPKGEDVKSLTLPFSDEEKALMSQVTKLWNEAEVANPQLANTYNSTRTFSLNSGESNDLLLSGSGTIKEMRMKVEPNTPEAWKALRLKVYWDNSHMPSIDLPAGYLFGNADYANKIEYSSLFIGQDSISPYMRLPMPYRKNARIEIVNTSDMAINEVQIMVDNDTKALPKAESGYLHVTWTEQYADSISMPKWGKQNVPVHQILERSGLKGKYVGTILHIGWPSAGWWGEGDLQIWSDEDGFPPSYHGTGTEEYFNSGWCLFDRKAISGFVKTRPGNVEVYSFHLLDNFNFDKNFKMQVEKWPYDKADQGIKAIWGTTAFWYAEYPTPAFSKQDLLSPRLVDNNPTKWEGEMWK